VNPEEGEGQQLEVATKQRLLKTEYSVCAAVTVIYGVCNSDSRSYLQLRSASVQ
jgi:hypothetical protein